MPMNPLAPRMVNALVVVVAVPATVVVEKYRLPPAFLNAHCAMPAPAESESCEAVVEAMVSVEKGVEVPRPRRDAPLSQKRELLVASADEPLPKRIEPELMLAQPLPPLATVSADVRRSEPLTVRLVPESAVGAHHWKTT